MVLIVLLFLFCFTLVERTNEQTPAAREHVQRAAAQRARGEAGGVALPLRGERAAVQRAGQVVGRVAEERGVHGRDQGPGALQAAQLQRRPGAEAAHLLRSDVAQARGRARRAVRRLRAPQRRRQALRRPRPRVHGAHRVHQARLRGEREARQAREADHARQHQAERESLRRQARHAARSPPKQQHEQQQQEEEQRRRRHSLADAQANRASTRRSDGRERHTRPHARQPLDHSPTRRRTSAAPPAAAFLHHQVVDEDHHDRQERGRHQGQTQVAAHHATLQAAPGCRCGRRRCCCCQRQRE